MKHFPIKTLVAVASLAAATVVNAATFNLGSTPTGELTNPGYFETTFSSSGADANASLSFVLEGFRSLDGINIYADLFTLKINDQLIGRGAFNLGGGGLNWSSGLGPVAVATPGLWQGGTATFSNVSFSLLQGNNTFRFEYAPIGPSNGFGGQGLADEAWGIQSASITTAVPEPESYAMLLAGLGIMGAVARRRSKNK